MMPMEEVCRLLTLVILHFILLIIFLSRMFCMCLALTRI
jgi:hypothetical protein